MTHRDVLPEQPDQLAELAGFAEMVAETALSFLEERRGRSAPTLAEQIVAGAVQVIPGTIAAAVENLDAEGLMHAPVMEGDDVARAVMRAQNETGQGPCLQALRAGERVVVDDVEADPRWPEFSARATELGIRAMVCVPMVAAGRTMGILSLLSDGPRFHGDEDTPVLASVFAAHAAVAMTGASRVEDVVAALGNRDVIGQAKGILMERFKITPDVAFTMLVRTSSATNLRLGQVCTQLCLTGVLLPDPPRAKRSRPSARGVGDVTESTLEVRSEG